MSDTISERMAADRATLQQQAEGGLDDLHTELDKSPIHEAARESDLEGLRAVVEKDGVDCIRALDKYGLTALHWAADRGNVECAQHLITLGADVNRVETRLFRRVPLHFSAIAPSSETVRLLLDNGADPHAVEYRGWSAYHFAAYAGAVDVMRELEARGVDAQTRTKATETALHIAASNGKVDAVRHLLEAGGMTDDVLHQPNASGKTALELAQVANHAEIVRLLGPTEGVSMPKADREVRVQARRGSGLDSISAEAASAPAS